MFVGTYLQGQNVSIFKSISDIKILNVPTFLTFLFSRLLFFSYIYASTACCYRVEIL